MAMRPRTSGGANNPTGNRQRGAPVRPVYEDFKPKSEWIQDQESDNLLIYLPEFTKENLKASTEGTNTLRVQGERIVVGNKWQRFKEDFQVPNYCNVRGTRARFEGGILTITIPKKIITPPPPPKEQSKPTSSSATTSKKIPEILPPKVPKDSVTQKVKEAIPPKTTSSKQEDKAKPTPSSTTTSKTIREILPPKVPKDSMTQKVKETIPPKATSSKQEDKSQPFQEYHVPPKPISPVPPKVNKEPMSQKVQENILPKKIAPNKEDKANGSQESQVPPKPISSIPPKVLKEPMSQKVQENILPKNSAPNKEDKVKGNQESPVSSNPISPVSESKKEKLPQKMDVEQKHEVDSGASKHQETLNATKAEGKRIPELMEAEETAKRRKIMEGGNNAEKTELVEKRIQETERIGAQKTAFVDQDEAKYRKRMATSSGTGHFEPRNFKKAVKSLAELDEERKLMVNMGAAVLVIMSLGAFFYHTVKN